MPEVKTITHEGKEYFVIFEDDGDKIHLLQAYRDMSEDGLYGHLEMIRIITYKELGSNDVSKVKFSKYVIEDMLNHHKERTNQL